MKSKYIALSILSILAIFLFLKQPLLSYFSQDDFYHFSEIWQKEITDIPGLLMPGATTTQFYRPITRELYNFFTYRIFKLWAFPYHVINLTMILVNGFVFLVVLKKIIGSKYFLFFTGWIYLFSAVHSVELYYLPAIQTLVAALSMLLSLLSYLEFREKNSLKFYYLSTVFFTFSLLSHESSMVFPGLLLAIEFIYLKNFRLNSIRKIIFRMTPFLLILGVRLLISAVFLEIPKEAVYQPVFSIGSMLNSLAWFILWSFGMPEMLVDFATLTLKFNPNLFKFYGQYFYSMFALLAIIFLSLLVMKLYLIKLRWILRKELFLFAFSFFVTILPFLFLPQHKFVYYLTFPLLWFCAFLGLIFYLYSATGKTSQLLVVLLLFSLTVISFKSVELNKITYWAAKRAVSAKYIVNDLQKKYPNVKKNTVIYIKDDPNYPFISKEWGTSSKQAFFILSGADAFHLLYNDPTIKAYYESVTGLPKQISPDKLIIYEATFPY